MRNDTPIPCDILGGDKMVEEGALCGKAEAWMRDKRKIFGRQKAFFFPPSFTLWFNFTTAKSPSYISHRYFWRTIENYQCKYFTVFQHLTSAAYFKRDSHASSTFLPDLCQQALPQNIKPTCINFISLLISLLFSLEGLNFLFCKCFSGGLFSFF